MAFSPSGAVQDCEYLMTRAETELALADAATSRPAAEAHRKLAGEYLGQIFGAERPELPRSRTQAEREKRLAIASAFVRLQQRPWHEGSAKEAGLRELLTQIKQG